MVTEISKSPFERIIIDILKVSKSNHTCTIRGKLTKFSKDFTFHNQQNRASTLLCFQHSFRLKACTQFLNVLLFAVIIYNTFVKIIYNTSVKKPQFCNRSKPPNKSKNRRKLCPFETLFFYK